MAEATRLGLVHPLRAWLEAFEYLLASRDDVQLVIAHSDEAWVRNAVARGEVDVVIVSLEGSGGLAPIRRMREARPDVGIVVISDDDATLEAIGELVVPEAIRAGARGWVAQSSSLERMLAVVKGVAHGETWFPPMHVSRLVDAFLRAEQRRQDEKDALARLSTREREILACLARGLTRPEIATKLYVSPNTVRTHINHVLRKLEVHSALAAVSLVRKASPTADWYDERSGRTQPGSHPPSGVDSVRTLPDPSTAPPS
jgi:DNA-binding NarL/FixJ family response regulator